MARKGLNEATTRTEEVSIFTILDDNKGGMRSCSRIANDEGTMIKAERLVAKRNLEEGNFQGNLLAAILEVATEGGSKGRLLEGVPSIEVVAMDMFAKHG